MDIKIKRVCPSLDSNPARWIAERSSGSNIIVGDNGWLILIIVMVTDNAHNWKNNNLLTLLSNKESIYL